jgi:hypothetical protein
MQSTLGVGVLERAHVSRLFPGRTVCASAYINAPTRYIAIQSGTVSARQVNPLSPHTSTASCLSGYAGPAPERVTRVTLRKCPSRAAVADQAVAGARRCGSS